MTMSKRESVSDALARAELEVARIIKYLRDSVRHYNNIKSHEYYVPLPKVKSIKARRTGRENLRIVSIHIPSSKVPETLEYVHVAAYLTIDPIVKKWNFIKRYDFMTRTLKHLEKSLTPEGIVAQHHSFIYFIAWGFRAGVYDEVREINAFYKDRGFNWRIRPVELRYDNSLYNEVNRDLTKYLGIRALRLLNSVGSRNPTIFSRPKHFIDYILFVLANLSGNKDITYEVEYLAQRYEVNIREYEKLLFQLGVSSEGRTEEAPIAATPLTEVAAPAITYRKESLSRDSELAEFWARYEKAEVE